MGAMTSSPSPTNASLDAATSMAVGATATPENVKTRVIRGREFTPPPNYDNKRLLYRPHGKWEWTKGFEIKSTDPGSRLSFGPEGAVNLKIGKVNDKEIIYISKLFSALNEPSPFFPYLYLNASSKYLRPLQGNCVPWIIGVFHCLGGQIGVAHDLPHSNGWREADMFLEEHQKEAVIAAYQKLHDRGIHHGAAEYRNWLIGDDGKVTIVEFGLTSVVECDAGAQLAKVKVCPIEKIQEEMRRVKFMLNYADSREQEFKLARLRHAREQKDLSRSKSVEPGDDKMDSLNLPTPEPMTDEEKASPFPAAKLDELNELMLACARWTAHRFTVDRIHDCAEVIKTAIPHKAPVAAAFSSSSERVSAPVSLISSPSTALPTSSVSSIGRNQLSTQRGAAATGPVNSTLPNPPNNSGVSLKRPRDEELSDEISDDEGSDTDIDSPMESDDEGANAVDKGKGKGREIQAPVNKRQKLDNQPTPPVAKPKPKTAPKPKPKAGPSKPAPLVRTSSIRDLTQPPPPFTFSRASPYRKMEIPAPKPASIPARIPTVLKEPEVLIGEATRAWTLFAEARDKLGRIQNALTAKQAQTGRYRDEFLRAILNAPAAERQALLECLGQKDSVTILDTNPKRPPPPTPADQASQHLQTQRVNIASVVANMVVRPGSRAKKENPRVRDIKRFERANYVPKKSSGLTKGSLKPPAPRYSRANPRAPHGMEDLDEDPSELSQETKDTMARLEIYRRVVARRVFQRSANLDHDAEDLEDLRAIKDLGNAPGEPPLNDGLAQELEERERRELERQSKGKGPEGLKDLKEPRKLVIDDYLARAFEEEEKPQPKREEEVVPRSNISSTPSPSTSTSTSPKLNPKPEEEVVPRNNMSSTPSTSTSTSPKFNPKREAQAGLRGNRSGAFKSTKFFRGSDEPDVDLNNMDDYEPDPIDEAAKAAVYEEAAAIEAGTFSFPPFERSPSPELYKAPVVNQSYGRPGASSSSSSPDSDSDSSSPSPPSSPPPASSSTSPQKRKREDTADEKEPDVKKLKLLA